jgi:hypothetical protein
VELRLAQAMGAILPLDLLSALLRTALYLAAAGIEIRQ